MPVPARPPCPFATATMPPAPTCGAEVPLPAVEQLHHGGVRHAARPLRVQLPEGGGQGGHALGLRGGHVAGNGAAEPGAERRRALRHKTDVVPVGSACVLCKAAARDVGNGQRLALRGGHAAGHVNPHTAARRPHRNASCLSLP